MKITANSATEPVQIARCAVYICKELTKMLQQRKFFTIVALKLSADDLGNSKLGGGEFRRILTYIGRDLFLQS